MGDRMDNIQPGAMPWLHRYVGNPVLTGFLNLFFRTGVSDAHCGMRALRRDVLPRARPAHDRHGVRLGDGDPGLQGEARHPRVPDRVPPARRRVASSRASATAGATCASCSSTARRTCSSSPALVMLALGALIVADRARAARRLRPRVGPAHDDRRRAADDRRRRRCVALGLCAHAYGTYFMGEQDPWFDRMRARFRLEHGLLLGGALDRSSGSSIGARDRRHLDRPRLRRALRGAARGARRDADRSSASRSSSPRSCSASSACARRLRTHVDRVDHAARGAVRSAPSDAGRPARPDCDRVWRSPVYCAALDVASR